MSGYFLVLLALSAFGVAGALTEVWRRRREVERLREEDRETYEAIRERWRR
ncbi:MAG: hypothetical protein AAF791_06450 [Bacteroidota bacterium]